MQTPVQSQHQRQLDVQVHAPLPEQSATPRFASPVKPNKARLTAYPLQAASLVVGLFFAFTGGVVQAQGASAPAAAAPLTREQVKMNRDEFIRAHRWDTTSDNWVLKPDMEAPSGMKTRAEVRAARDEFLRNHRWNPVTSQWNPLTRAPRDMGKMTRAQVRNETRQFLQTHEWDNVTEAWVETTPKKTKK